MTAPGDAITPSTDPPRPDARPDNWPRRLAPLAVALVCLVAAAYAARDVGFTTDEPRYIDNSQRLHAWFADLFTQGPSAAFDQDRMAEGWYWARPESKNLPLVSLVGSLGHFTLGLFDSPPHSYRWGNLVVLAVTCGVVFSWIREELSPQAATVAVVALVGMPRVWTQALLMSIDPLVASFQVLACWALWRSRSTQDASRGNTWRWPIAFGVLAGVGAMAKPTFWLIVPAWIAWGLLSGPRRNRKAALCLVTVAPLAALALMPPWWGNPVGEFLDYINMLLDDPAGWKIDVYYLGHIFQAELAPGTEPVPVPWHSVPLLSLVTTPPWILVLIAVEVLGLGLRQLAVRLARRAQTAPATVDLPPPHAPPALEGLWLIALLVLPLVVMLPSTPAHDGTRLYRPAFYFAALIAAAGFERLRRRWLSDSKPLLAWAAAAGLGIAALWTHASIHPAGLSYYNVTVGGFTEAVRPIRQPRTLPELNRPLFEVSYWWELFNREAIDSMQQHLPPGARLTFFPEHYGRHMLKQWGHLRDDIQLVGTSEAQYMVMYARMGRLLDPRVHPSGSRFLYDDPIWEWTVHGVRVVVLVRVNQPRATQPGPHPSPR